MHIRSIISGGLALLLVPCATAIAHEVRPDLARVTSGTVQPAAFLGLFRKNEGAPQPTLVQADPRVMQLEEEIRKLSGTVEELNFQILQMQEQMRKMQEDNEFRFQQLEGGGAMAPARQSGELRQSEPADQSQHADGSGARPRTVLPGPDGGTGQPAAGALDLGTLTVDPNGNVTASTMEVEPGQNRTTADDTTVAALPSADDPDELYRTAYEFVLAGDYRAAESGFREHIERFPADPRTADARYWLGESLLGQKKYRDAAEVFLAASKDYPKATKAPDMMLKLGVSLASLNQRDVACATYREIGKRYPGASEALKLRVKQEQALAAC